MFQRPHNAGQQIAHASKCFLLTLLEHIERHARDMSQQTGVMLGAYMIRNRGSKLARPGRHDLWNTKGCVSMADLFQRPVLRINRLAALLRTRDLENELHMIFGCYTQILVALSRQRLQRAAAIICAPQKLLHLLLREARRRKPEVVIRGIYW